MIGETSYAFYVQKPWGASLMDLKVVQVLMRLVFDIDRTEYLDCQLLVIGVANRL